MVQEMAKGKNNMELRFVECTMKRFQYTEIIEIYFENIGSLSRQNNNYLHSASQFV